LCAAFVVLVAAGEHGDQIAVCVLAVCWCGGARDICVEEVLRDHCEFGENGAVPSKRKGG